MSLAANARIVLSRWRRLFEDGIRRDPLCIPAAWAVAVCFSLATPAASAQTASAQPDPPLPVSLAEALARAVRASDERALARYGVDSAKAQQLVAQSGYYPQLSVSASYERTLASEFDAVFSSVPAQPAAANTGDTAALAFDELPFGRENVYRVGGTLSQSLFAGGGTRAATRSARALAHQAEIGIDTADAETALATVEAYYDALLSDRFVAISTQTLQRAQATLDQVQLSRQEAQQSEYDLLRARVALENERPNLVARQMQRKLAYLRLSQRMGLPAERELRLTSTLEQSAPLPRQGTPPALDASTRAPVRQAEAAVRASDANVDSARAADYPNVSLAMSYGRVNYPSGVLPGTSDWRTNWTVGAYVSWSVFEGFRNRGQVHAAEAEAGRARARLSQTRKLAEYDAQSALEQLAAAEAVYNASAGTAEQANRAYAIAELRYREGVSTQLELTDARLSLAQAEINRAQATRDREVARVRRALLPNLPLAAGGTADSSPSTQSPPMTQTPATPAPAQATGSSATATAPASPGLTNSTRAF
jgi:outer membrane protein